MHRAILLMGLALLGLLVADGWDDEHYTPFPVMEGRLAGSWRMCLSDRWDLEDGEEALADVRIDIDRVLRPYVAVPPANVRLYPDGDWYEGRLTIGGVARAFTLRTKGISSPELDLDDAVAGDGPIERRIRGGLTATMLEGVAPEDDELFLGFGRESDGSVYPLRYERVARPNDR